ncbi:MAG: alpha/beta hydrolase [Anaerolineae bacterium]|nr:alpha/beta hydrolase [Gemmatimonadaceae bacterium]
MSRSVVKSNIMILACLLVAPLLGVHAQTRPPATISRDSITSRLADLRRIHTPEGIEVLEQIDVGGTKQWISIRGLNLANPVLLVIHGGPGSPLMGSSWAFQKPWEDFFTVVQWEQRGVGKNFVGTDTAAVGKTLSNERLTQDAEEVVAYLRRRLSKDKIVVMGFSWGTIMGTRLALRRPEWLYAYVGVGQSAVDGERYLYERVVGIANARRDTAAIRELREVAPYPGPKADLTKALLVRKYARRYDGGWYGKPDFKLYFSLPEWGPEYTQADVDAHLKGMRWAGEHVVEDPDADTPADQRDTFKVPVILMMGWYDLHTPHDAAKAYFARIDAPAKKFITFERSAHFLMFEEPGRFLVTLVNEVLPLTGERPTFKRLQ